MSAPEDPSSMSTENEITSNAKEEPTEESDQLQIIENETEQGSNEMMEGFVMSDGNIMLQEENVSYTMTEPMDMEEGQTQEYLTTDEVVNQTDELPEQFLQTEEEVENFGEEEEHEATVEDENFTQEEVEEEHHEVEMDQEEIVESAVENYEETVEDSIPLGHPRSKIISTDGTVLELNPLSNYKKIQPKFTTSSALKRNILPANPVKNVTKVVFQNPNNSPSGASPYKIIGRSQVGNSQPRHLTWAEAQQLGLITPGSKVQQIMPGGSKRMIVKKIIPTSNSNLLPPTKILPSLGSATVKAIAKPSSMRIPVSNVSTMRGIPMKSVQSNQIRQIPVTFSSAKPNFVSIKPNVQKGTHQKVIIRQGSAGGGAGTVIRIPSGSAPPLQIGGKQVQYVKLVSASSSGTSNIMTNAKPKYVKNPSYKAIPITPSPGGMKTYLSKPAQSPKRVLIPVSQSTPQVRHVFNEVQLKGAASPIVMDEITVTPPMRSGQKLHELKASEDGSIIILPTEVTDEQKIEEDELQKINEQLDKDNNISEETDPESSSQILDCLEANGMRMKKPCNCTRSQCLKLYCECFANGEFCFQCNCINCFNNIDHEGERQKSIKSCLDRNPDAFRPKIQLSGESEEEERKHNKGCHCKRSGCLKNYCECYEAKIVCSQTCKCVGCRNTEEFLEGGRSGLIDLADVTDENFFLEKTENLFKSTVNQQLSKQPYNFISSDVIEATCQCLMAQAEDAIKHDRFKEEGEKMILEEFGRCLIQIIACSRQDDIA